jgi:hypothetical protein
MPSCIYVSVMSLESDVTYCIIKCDVNDCMSKSDVISCISKGGHTNMHTYI